MKTPILKFLLLLCLVFLGFKSAQAGSTISYYDPGTPSTVYSGQTGIVEGGITIKTTNNTTTTLNSITFTINQVAPNIDQISNFKLFSSASGTALATVASATIGSGVSTVTFSWGGTNVKNTTTDFYMTFDFTGTGSGTDYKFTVTNYNAGTNVTPNANNYNNIYTLSAPTLTLAQDNTGLDPTAQSTSDPSIAVYGMSATSVGPSTFTALTFTTTSATGDNISPTYSTVTLYKSTSTNSTSFSKATPVTGASAVITNPSTVTINLSTPQSIGDGVKVYYFLVVSYNQPTAADVKLQFNTPTITSTNGTVTTGNANGQVYTLSAPPLTVTATSLGSTGGTAPSNGLTNDPIVGPQTKVPIYGLQLSGAGVGTAKTITSLVFSPEGTQNNSFYYGAMYLYSSTSSTFMGIGAPQTSATPLSTTTTTTGNKNNITFSGLNISVANGTTLYYFVLVDCPLYSPTNASQSELDFYSATGATVAAGTANQGYDYTYSKPKLTLAANNAGALSNTANLDHDLSQTVFFSFSATSAGTSSLTGITLTGTTSMSANFSNMALYSSTSPTFPGTESATLVKTLTAPNSTSYSITNLTESLTNTTLYYYLVADYTDNVVDASNPTYTFKLTAATSTPTASGTTVTGAAYTMASPVTLAAPGFTNMAVNPLTTNASASGKAILGFTVTTTQAETFTRFVLTTAPGSSISPYFSGTPTLYVNTTNSGTGGTAVSVIPGNYSVTSTTITITPAVAQTFSGATTKYYYLVFPTYTAPTTSATFELDASSVSTSAYTYTNGAPAQGTSYALGPPVYDWNGSTNTGTVQNPVYSWTTPANWSIGGVPATAYPGQNGNTDQVRFGTNYNYTGTHQPTLNTSVTVASILFGYNNGNHDGNNINVNLTVTGATLTAGTITQNHNASHDVYTLITGTGNLVCTGNFAVGDATQPAADELNITNVTTTINHMTINGNIIFNANGNGSTGSVDHTNGGGNNYPYFGLQKNTLSLYGQLIFNSNNNPISFGTGRGGDAVDYYQNVARFNMDMIASSPTYLELYNANTIPSPNANNYVDFTDLKGGSTVSYMDPNANETQMVYTNGTLGLGTNDYNYINLVFSGASKKQVAGDVFSVGGSWVTSGGDIDLSTNAPSTYITYNTQTRNVTDKQTTNTANNYWTNSCNVSQGAASVEVGYTMTNTGNITCGSGTMQIDGQFTNNAGSFVCGSGKVIYKGGYLNKATFTAGTGAVYFTGTQTLQDISTGGTTFNDVYCNSGTATISSGTGNFAVSNIGRLFVNSNSTLAAGTGTTGYLTLISDGTSTATVEPLATASGTVTGTITGNVNVQRFITGGPFRGYRLFSSAVNINQKTNQNGTGSSTEGFIDPTYLNSGMITGGPGTGFISNHFANPLSYLYDDTRASSASQFFSGKNVGIYSISGSPTYQVTPMSTGGTALSPFQLPVGNSMLTFYTGKVSLSSASPESNVATATGTLNQGNIILWIFKPTAAATQTLVLPNANSTLGLNQIGNPYPSTIQLSTFYNDNKTHIQPVVYELDATTGITGTYLGYNAKTSTTSSTNRASNYVVSGQGFWVQGLTGSTGTVTFKETEKVDYPNITSATTTNNGDGTLLMDIPGTVSNNDIKAGSFAENTSASTATSAAPALVGLHLQLSKDSVKSAAYLQTGIYFSNQWTDTFNAEDDAIDRDGATPKIYFSSYSSDAKRLCINQLADYGKGKRVKLYAGATTSGLYYMSIADLLNIDTVNYNVYLVDNKMNDSLDMVKYKSYAFNINNADTSTYGANRFILAVERKALPPYELITFSGQKVSNGVQLFWKTLNEGTYTNFAVQKLGGSNTYSSIYTTQGTGAGIYSDVDLHPSNGANTYRLQQTDINGIVTYSQPVTINYSAVATNGSLTIYPNPSKTIINISLNTSNTGSKNYIADIYNTSGSVVGHKIVNADTWTQDISAYKLGVYVIEIKTDTGNLVGQSKFVKIN